MTASAKDMKITALAPWYGGKRTLAPTIIREAGRHNAWWEPFCGGISVLLSKRRVRQEVLNDLHGDITNLAVCVASPRWIDLYERSAASLYSEGLYEACKSRILLPFDDWASHPQEVSDAQVDRAFTYLVLCWMGRKGTAGTARLNYQFTLRYTCNGGDSAATWLSVGESIPWWHQRLRGVAISRRDGLEMLKEIDDADGTVIYLDPTYIEEGDAYAHALVTRPAGLFGDRDDHERLAELAHGFRNARVIISYYDHPRLAQLYPRWTRVDCAMRKNLAVQNKRGQQESVAPEILLINGESYQTTEDS